MTENTSFKDVLTETQKQYLARKSRESVVIGYIQLGLIDTDADGSMPEIHQFAHDNEWTVYGIVKDRVSGMTGWKARKQLKQLTDLLKTGDRLLVNELSRLGRSVSDIISLIADLHKRGIAIYDIKNQWRIDDSIQTRTLLILYEMAVQMDSALISMRVKEGLALRKAKGLPLGRKKGTGRSKLDTHKNEITTLLKAGSTKAYIMKKFNTSKTNLYNWLRRNDLDKIVPVYNGNSSRKAE